MREELRAAFAGVQQQQGVGEEVDDSSTAARQQHVLSGPHAVDGSSAPVDDAVVISLTSSLKVPFLSFSAMERILSSTVPCSTGLVWAAVFFGTVMVERSDLCSSVKDSSHVT